MSHKVTYPKSSFVIALSTIQKSAKRYKDGRIKTVGSIRPRIPTALKGRGWNVIDYTPNRKNVILRFDKA